MEPTPFVSLHSSITGGIETWNDTLLVTVKNGTFAVQLSGFPAGTFNSSQHLEIKIGTDAPLTPRQQLVSVAYAMKANTVPDGSLTAAKFATGALNNLSWLLGGNSGTNPASQFLGTTDNQPLVFRTNNVERMRILGDGKVGIGTGDPVFNLMVQGPSDTELCIYGVGGHYWTLQSSGPNAEGQLASSFQIIDRTLHVSRVLIDVQGNVGIGTSAPAAKLDVAGTAQMTGFKLSTDAAAGRVLTSDASGNGTWQIAGSGSGWTLTGNVGTNPATNFLGTTDNQPLVFRVNNVEEMRLTASGLEVSNGIIAGDIGTGNILASRVIAREIDTEDIETNYISTDDINVTGRIYAANISATGDIDGDAVTANDIATHYISSWHISVYGDITATGNMYATAFIQSSDARYKQHIATIPNALDTILNLRGVTFDWNQDAWKEKRFPAGKQIGFIAQEVEKVLPELVTTDQNGYKSVAYANVVPVLVEAVKTLKKENDQKDAQIAALEARIAAIEASLRARKAGQ